MNREKVPMGLIYAAVGMGAVALIGGYYLFLQYQQTNVHVQERMARDNALTISEKLRTGNLDTALQAYNDSLSASHNMREAGPIIIAGAELTYSMASSSNDAIKSIRLLKTVASSPETRPFIKAQAILNIANWQYNSGYDQSVFDEIFKDEPYQSDLFYENGVVNRASSIRRLLQYSYDVWPTYQAAIDIASGDLTVLYRTTNQRRVTGQDFLQNAEEYLVHSEDLVFSNTYEQAKNRSSLDSYYLQRAVVIGELAHFKGEPYTQSYKKAFDEAVARFSAGSDIGSRRMLALTHFWYAAYLLDIDHETTKAKEQLAEAVTLVKNDPDRANNYLVERISAMKQKLPQYKGRITLDPFVKISPEFKTFVAGIN